MDTKSFQPHQIIFSVSIYEFLMSSLMTSPPLILEGLLDRHDKLRAEISALNNNFHNNMSEIKLKRPRLMMTLNKYRRI